LPASPLLASEWVIGPFTEDTTGAYRDASLNYTSCTALCATQQRTCSAPPDALDPAALAGAIGAASVKPGPGTQWAAFRPYLQRRVSNGDVVLFDLVEASDFNCDKTQPKAGTNYMGQYHARVCYCTVAPPAAPLSPLSPPPSALPQLSGPAGYTVEISPASAPSAVAGAVAVTAVRLATPSAPKYGKLRVTASVPAGVTMKCGARTVAGQGKGGQIKIVGNGTLQTSSDAPGATRYDNQDLEVACWTVMGGRATVTITEVTTHRGHSYSLLTFF
jgi:hypothetical protein